MEFKDLSFSTKLKLTAGPILVWVGLVFMLMKGPIHAVTVLFGNMLSLDGRISRMEEENESNRQQTN